MKSMKRYFVALLAVMCSASTQAQAICAGDLEQLCTAKNESDRLSCALIVKVYMDGFIEGVAKGVIDTYKLDPQVLALVKEPR